MTDARKQMQKAIRTERGWGAITLPLGVNLLRGFTLDKAYAQEIINNTNHEHAEDQQRNRASQSPVTSSASVSTP